MRVTGFTYGGGEKYKSLTGKRGEKRDTGVQSIPTLYNNTRVSMSHFFFRGYRVSTTRWMHFDRWK